LFCVSLCEKLNERLTLCTSPPLDNKKAVEIEEKDSSISTASRFPVNRNRSDRFHLYAGMKMLVTYNSIPALCTLSLSAFRNKSPLWLTRSLDHNLLRLKEL
jgi:hypothetical protein